LFTGMRGIGKTSAARILAKALNCERGPTDTPCLKCDPCREITAGQDVDLFEIDGASHTGVDDIRKLKETLPYKPVRNRYRIYIIDEVHMLSISAFNALLKSLEEPPLHVKFIFATTEPHKIPQTVLSRAQRFDFKRIPPLILSKHLEKIAKNEGIEIEPSSLNLIAQEAEGSVRDALSLLDQIASFAGKKITYKDVTSVLGIPEQKIIYELSSAILQRDSQRCVEILKEISDYGYDIPHFTTKLLHHFRDLIIISTCKNYKGILDLPQEEIQRLQKEIRLKNPEDLHRIFYMLSQTLEEINQSEHPSLILEMAVLRLTFLPQLRPINELITRLEKIETQLDSKSEKNSLDSFSFEDKNKLWNKILASIMEKDPALGAILNTGIVQEFSEDKIKICFAKDSIGARRFSSLESQNYLKEIIKSYLKSEPKLEIITNSKINIPLRIPKNEDSLRQEALKHPLVQQIISLFNAEIKKVSPHNQRNFNNSFNPKKMLFRLQDKDKEDK
jgi:DNA polymerase-3 subunit gamma/tau